ncbi:ChbG/HpnK family deacetylase [Roseibium aestuarii]|uniref:ChbG/HpnK family deacetylase n=1 Tax=Roseibium aestuarii TaxID=2600299 RepID=A0ABW4JXD5_9HYPH|nr:ChbG/HpnK family deacetylase [Roseibium aestuarii]
MKKIILGSLDYGLAFGIDRTLRDLLAQGRLSAVGCLVGGDLWPREWKPLHDLVQSGGSRMLVGLSLALSGDVTAPLGERMREAFHGRFPSRARLERQAVLRLLPDEIIHQEIGAQLSAFHDRLGFWPDFIAVREGLMSYGEIQRLVLEAVEGFELPVLPALVGPADGARAARKFRRRAEARGFPVLDWGAPVPEIGEEERLFRQLRHHFDPMSDDTFVATLAGEPDDRLRRAEPVEKLALRDLQRKVLASDRFFQLLDDREVFLT